MNTVDRAAAAAEWATEFEKLRRHLTDLAALFAVDAQVTGHPDMATRINHHANDVAEALAGLESAARIIRTREERRSNDNAK